MSDQQRILIVNRHFWPDVGTYGQMLRQIGARWSSDGHLVDVLTAQPSYRPELGLKAPRTEIDGGVSIYRLWLFRFRSHGLGPRLLNSIPFFAGMSWHLLKRRLSGKPYDFVLVATNPPVLEALLARLLCALLGGRIIYHLQDIHPEVEVSAGIIGAGGLVARILLALDNFVCQSAAACVTLSEDMKRQLLARFTPDRTPPDIRVINNFIFDLDEQTTELLHALRRPAETFRVIFAGNIGFFQGLEQLVAAAHQLADTPDIDFMLLGNGLAVPDLHAAAGDLAGKTVRFVPFQPMAVAHALVEDADLAVIALKPGVIRLAYPSKTMTYASTGTPILAIVEADSALAQTIAGEQLGLVAPQDDVGAIASTIRQAYRDRDALRAGRAGRRQRGIALFGADRALDAWSALILQLSARR